MYSTVGEPVGTAAGEEEETTCYESFIAHHPQGSFMQSSRWAQVKSQWGCERILIRDETGDVCTAMQVLIRKIPLFPFSFLYASRGPVGNYLEDEEVLGRLTGSIRELCRRHRAFLFKMDPMIPEDDAPSIEKLRRAGFSFTAHRRNEQLIQCRSQYVLPLSGRTEEEVFASFHPKWRYNIRLAMRKGVTCRPYGCERLDDFCRLMEETGARDHFQTRSRTYFQRMLTALGEHARLYLCEYQGIPLAGAIAVQYAGRTCYVYGASTSLHRECMPNYLLQWEMIRWALESGDRLYDFQGIPYYFDETHPNYGVYRFKRGFHGEIVNYAGEFDYIPYPAVFRFVTRAWRLFRHRGL